MLILKKIAVTGGLACGKSQVCHILKKLGAYVVSADEIVHQLLSPSTSIGKQVISLFGTDIVIGDKINRATLATKVFNQKDQLKALEEILHPAVRAEISRLYEQVKEEESFPLFVAEIPLFYESEDQTPYDAVITVVANEELSKARFGNAEEWQRRMERQLPVEEKAKRADYVIKNNGSLTELEELVKQIYEQITGE